MLKIQYLPQYTVADYMSWEGHWELIHGIPYAMSPSPTSGHQRVAKKIVQLLESVLSAADCHCEVFYELDWHVMDDTVVRPDILVVRGRRLKDDFVKECPAFITEVLSPSTAEKDRSLKAELYASQGVQYYLLADYTLGKSELLELKNGIYEKVGDDRSIDLGGCAFRLDHALAFA